MRHVKTLTVTMAVLLLMTGAAMAQQPTHQHDATQQPPASATKPSTPSPGADAHMAQPMGQHMAQHMEMCRMMGQAGMMGGGMGAGMMGGGMMGMPMMMGGDPK
jgi:hypothetical protein